MFPRGIETRLRRLEVARRPNAAAFFLLWGRNPAELETRLEDAKERGAVTRGDPLVRAIWTGNNGTPPARWIASVRGDLLTGEDDALVREIERRTLGADCDEGEDERATNRAREMSDAELYAAALGEPVS
jgi:hypothetical protein